MFQKTPIWDPMGTQKSLKMRKKSPPENRLKNEPKKVSKNDQNKPVSAWEREARLIGDMLRSTYDTTPKNFLTLSNM